MISPNLPASSCTTNVARMSAREIEIIYTYIIRTCISNNRIQNNIYLHTTQNNSHIKIVHTT